jgi:autotransporter-associated beta strand protein
VINLLNARSRTKLLFQQGPWNETLRNLNPWNTRKMKHTDKLINFLLIGGLFLLVQPAFSAQGDATWLLNPPDNNWNNPANWTGLAVPTAAAIFSASNVRDINITQRRTEITDVIFNISAFYDITALPGVAFILKGSVMNNFSFEQNFIAQNSGDSSGGFIFDGDSDTLETITGPVTFTQQATNTVGGSAGFVKFHFAGAGDATFHNLGASAAGGTGGTVGFFFGGDTSAENCTIINEGATAAGATGGSCTFSTGTPTAANATLIANGGANGGGGGFFGFFDQATGGTAQVILSGNGYLDMSGHDGALTIGSLEGDGIVYLGRNRLSVGSNALNTTFDGLLLPGDPNGGPGTGSLTKTGSGTLTLSGANRYTNGTTVTDGTLVVNSPTGSATGAGAVHVNAGTLGGSKNIAGPVTIGTGSGSGAFLAPAVGGNSPRRLTIQGSLTFNPDATYTCTLEGESDKSRIDNVLANGVTINSGAIFNLSGTTQGQLTQGTVLAVIRNTAATPIAGTFSNLPDGAIVTVNGNNLQASYEGGDGNDLTLTVVP